MWRLLFLLMLVVILIVVYPWFVRVDVKVNVLKLKAVVHLIFLNKIVVEYKVRIKNGYVYINHKNKQRKEKLSAKNVNIIFFLNLIKEMYFRQQLLTLGLTSNFGYIFDANVTAVGCGYIDVVSKCVFSKIKNNKKSAHIFVLVEPKYNEDICNLKVVNESRMSIFDALYAIVIAWVSTKVKQAKGV
ncbi:MAG: hypothetical protein MJ149_00625 [Clostridia bacterium]|nr:hypothetical protein [Clostridia bacterium]